MGPAGEASKADAQNAFFPHQLRAIPSPALSSNASLDSPTLQRTLTAAATPGPWSPYAPSSASSAILPSEPAAPKQAIVMTPPAERHADNELSHRTDMDIIAGGALAPVHNDAPPQRVVAKPGPGLRLPCFEALGIASPFPHDLCLPGADSVAAGAARERAFSGGLRSRSDPGPVEDVTFYASDAGRANDVVRVQSPGACAHPPHVPLHHYVHTLTPPAETGEPNWRPALITAAMDSPDTETGATPVQSDSMEQSVKEASGAMQNVSLSTPSLPEDKAWLEGAVQTICQSIIKDSKDWANSSAVLNLRTSPVPNPLLKVLSHALPSPSNTGHAYTSIIEAIHDSTPASPTIWINVFHAIPGRFNLEELPTSPPNTPGPPIGGDDYFTQKVFGSAVPITDYQQDLSSLPRSPRPVVPPSSIDVSIVERYIPPSSHREFKDMFSVDGPSILIDRLVELSPRNGSLVFIYPTRTGAQTFMHEYLSPILDPVLRSTVTAHGLSSELCLTLGSMPSVAQLLDHAELERKTVALCAHLTQRSSTMARFHGSRAHFSLVHSSTKRVPLCRQAWAKDWWTKQEKTRVTEAVMRTAQEAQTKSSNRHVDRPPSATELWQKLLKDVETRPYDVGCEPKKGVEVAVFVVRRSE